ncbi:MAG: aminoglycoside phosphotransferase family protein, partial [Burkholderiales bacterium]
MRLDFSQAAPGSREAQLWQWLQQRCQRFGLVLEQLAPASSDASFRRYFRLPSNLHGSLVVMDAPPGLEDCAPFLKVQRLFAQAGLHVPEIMEADLTVGFLLLEDLGQTPYLSALTTETAPSLYGQALQSLVQLQSATQAGTLPPYSVELLKREMELFHEWYCGKHLGLKLSTAEHDMLERTFALLIVNNLAQPQVYVHRDYHSRNLMVLEQNGPGIIDFQDAVIGPITYDAVSLLRDAYIQWEEEQLIDWLVRDWEQARPARLPGTPECAEVSRDFE